MFKIKDLHKLFFVFSLILRQTRCICAVNHICQGSASLPFVNDPTDPNSLWSDSFSDSLKEAVFAKKGGGVLFLGIFIAMIGQPKAVLLKTNHRISQWSRTRSRRDYGPADFGSLQTEASVKLPPLAAFFDLFTKIDVAFSMVFARLWGRQFVVLLGTIIKFQCTRFWPVFFWWISTWKRSMSHVCKCKER